MKNVIVVVFCMCCAASYAQEVGSVADGQAIFIYNFTKLVAWPEDRKMDEFTIGVLGSSVTFNAIKEYTKQKRVAGQNISVKRFKDVAEVEYTCHVLMVTSSSSKEIDAIIGKAKNENILLIAEKDGAIEKGAAINFLLVDGKIKYEIKTSNIASCQLKYAAQLESLAYKKY